jgi:hypothetical protein
MALYQFLSLIQGHFVFGDFNDQQFCFSACSNTVASLLGAVFRDFTVSQGDNSKSYGIIMNKEIMCG